MIISTDHSYIRTSAWQQELSREEVFRRFPDKRSWWIDSSGEVFDAGNDHEEFIKEHSELFDHNEIWTTYHAVRKFWVRVSAWGPSFTINSRDINQKQLDAAQILYMREGGGKKVEFFQDGVIPTSFNKEEFLEINNVGQLKRMRTRYADTASMSGWMKNKYPDKRSWWVKPDGKVIDAGYDHDKTVRQNPEIFWYSDPEELLEEKGWASVGSYGDELVINARSFNHQQLEAAQTLYHETNKPFVYLVFKDIYGRITKDEFLQANSIPQLRKELRVRFANRKASREDRAWLISPDNEVIACGQDHANFVNKNRDLLRSMGAGERSLEQLVKEGWGQVGLLGPLLYIRCEKITSFFFKVLQELIKKTPQAKRLLIRNRVIDRQDFLSMDDPIELRWIPEVASRKTSSLPKSRNFLMEVSLEEMSWPLRQAFDLLNLSDKKDKLSANQVVSAFQANDEFLQDHIGRTSTELIRDLNAMFQYGSAKRQLTDA